jgi:hypothetical protein
MDLKKINRFYGELRLTYRTKQRGLLPDTNTNKKEGGVVNGGKYNG